MSPGDPKQKGHKPSKIATLWMPNAFLASKQEELIEHSKRRKSHLLLSIWFTFTQVMWVSLVIPSSETPAIGHTPAETRWSNN